MAIQQNRSTPEQEQSHESVPAQPINFIYPEVGRIRTVTSKDVESSPLGVGFETLDRMMFDPTRAYDLVGGLGVKWARCQTGWARTERKLGEHEFEWLDEITNSLLAQAIQPWFSISYGNTLYSPDAPSWPAVGWAPIGSEEAKTAWRRYVRALVERFADRITHFEIWNEVNASAFWQPYKPSPQSYMDLIRQTVDVIREAAPDVKIIGGAFTGMPEDFLEGALDLGLGDLVDVISFHPYGRKPETRGNDAWEGEDRTYPDAVNRWTKTIAERNSDIIHWQGECGLPSKGGKGAGFLMNYEWDEMCQAKWLPRRILMDLISGIDMTSYFTSVDLDYGMGTEPDKINYKGLIRGTDYSLKPAYFVYQCLCALFDANTQLNRVEVKVRETSLDAGAAASIQTARFVRNGRPIFAYWFPSMLPDEFSPGTVSLELPFSNDVGVPATIDDPVLIDPMSQKVFTLPAVSREEQKAVVANLPLADYPLLITDRSVAQTV